MSNQYQSVLWNPQKRRYDSAIAVGVMLSVAVFALATLAWFPQVTVETLIIRAFGATAFTMLSVVLAIGPLARLDTRALPLLYNRRHLGVATCLVALVHGSFATIQFHTLGDVNPLASLLSAHPASADDGNIAFQVYGFIALCILLVMAATSHDFWLANLSAPVWKALHMLVYVAYVCVIVHVAFGAMQDQGVMPLAVLLSISGGVLGGVHLAAAWRGRVAGSDPGTGWAQVPRPLEIADSLARVVRVAGDRAAVFRFGDELLAVSAVCQHQNGPLGEGCIVDGLITCPWHGYQYNPRNGRSPAPYTETIPTFDLKVEQGALWIRSTPNAPGSASASVNRADLQQGITHAA
ncbi:MAG: ferric reductase-like transmembrane domain-containing protein [Pseudomonadota bacterium]